MNTESLIKQVSFIIEDLNVRLMEENDFNAVYQKVKVGYTDLIRILYSMGCIPGDKMIYSIMSGNLPKIIKRC
jgi:hypothetical protein